MKNKFNSLFKFLLVSTLFFSPIINGTEKADHSDKKAFEKALGTYDKLHKAFFDNELKSINKVSAQLNKELSTLQEEQVKKALSFTGKKLADLEKATNIEQAQMDFNVVSQGILVVLDKHIPIKNYARYYCPMVKKYWIQNISESEKVMNPYAADTMPHCGGKME